MNSLIGIGSTFLLGSFHALEPGHGKTFLTANLIGQKFNIREVLTMALSMLFSHFFLLVILAFVLKYVFTGLKGEMLDGFTAIGIPVIVMGFGVFLLFRSFHHNHNADCGCYHHHEGEKGMKKAAAIGLISGLLPCPTVIFPVLMSGVESGFSNVLFYIFVYVLGMSLVLTSFALVVYFGRDFIVSRINKFSGKLNLQLLSACLIIAIGMIYLGVNLFHEH